MKTGHEIRVDDRRKTHPPGGVFENLDDFRKGRVQIIESGLPLYEAALILDEINHLRKLNLDATWEQFAIISRNKADLNPVRALLESKGIPVDYRADTESLPSPFRIREIHSWLLMLHAAEKELWSPDTLSEKLEWHTSLHGNNPWCELLYDITEEWKVATGNGEFPVRFLYDFFVEALQEYKQQKRRAKGVILSNAHKVKGLEFPHVFILSPHWQTSGSIDKVEEERRLYYVAMTRAEQTLTLFQSPTLLNWLECLEDDSVLRRLWEPSAPQQLMVNTVSGIHYEIIGFDEVFISYAGLRSPGTRIHQALSSLKTGSQLSLIHNGKSIAFRTGDRVEVASLSAKGRSKWESLLSRIQKIETKAIVTRYKDDGETPAGMNIRSDSWEIPIVEAVWDESDEAIQMVAEEQSGYGVQPTTKPKVGV